MLLVVMLVVGSDGGGRDNESGIGSGSKFKNC